jgi:PHD/YefM family antitoxin component YafN of YafNO toxin-antitoxin module
MTVREHFSKASSEPVIINSGGEPYVVMISYEEYERLKKIEAESRPTVYVQDRQKADRRLKIRARRQ